MAIERNIFNEPSGDVRGIMVLTMPFGAGKKQKPHRVAHATLLVGLPPDLTLSVPPGPLTLDELIRLSEGLTCFAEEVRNA